MTSLLSYRDSGRRVVLTSPTAIPAAGTFLWNSSMLLQVNCRGYTNCRFLEPELSSYSRHPFLEAASFMQPEQPVYAHHPGRFFYFKDEDTERIFSAPYEPCRVQTESWEFVASSDNTVEWTIRVEGLRIAISLRLADDQVLELWSLSVTNERPGVARLSIYPAFTVGYLSWMNQSASYDPDLNGILARSVTPYQNARDLPSVLRRSSNTALMADKAPIAWETRAAAFEGEGGLACPTSVLQPLLSCGDARYEMPKAVLQYRETLAPGDEARFNFTFGPFNREEELRGIRAEFLGVESRENQTSPQSSVGQRWEDAFSIETPSDRFQHFVNHWLSRQVLYHTETARMTHDPQTRNYLQDAMGACYIDAGATREAILKTLSQQNEDGSVPDGVLLHPEAELQYINCIPHSDHALWLVPALVAYLHETSDLSLLQLPVVGANDQSGTVYERICRALDWLLERRDSRGLSFIGEGDWCDPMNRVGPRGIGVSTWLTQAVAWSVSQWAAVCDQADDAGAANHFTKAASDLRGAINKHCWDGKWYSRGITDDGVSFGIAADDEGRMFLNPQSWAILSGTCDLARAKRLISAVEENLESPYGVEMLAPSYTSYRDDVGRLTQKHPGVAENGSVYNHASAFYCLALYQAGEADRAFEALMKMIPGATETDLRARGQLPVYLPNYYRGAWRQFPEVAGRSSHLWNTGTCSWVYRIVIEELFGLRGCPQGLRVQAALPSFWPRAVARRRFRGALIEVSYSRADVTEQELYVDGSLLADGILPRPVAGERYRLEVVLPQSGGEESVPAP